MRLFFLWLILLACATPAEARWREASSRHFVIYSEQSESELRRYAEELERFDRTLRLHLGRPDPERSPATRLSIYVLEDLDALQRFLNSDSVAGIYFPRVSGSVSFTAGARERDYQNDEQALTPRIVLFHEYTHHFIFNNSAFGAPLWLSEGYPEFWSTVQFDDDGNVRYGIPALHRNAELSLARPMRVQELLALRYPIRDGETVAVAYGRGWLLTHYLFLEPSRAGQLNAYLRALGQGQSAEEAAAVFGDLGQLDRELQRYLRRSSFSYRTVDAAQVPPGPVSIRQLSNAEEAVMRVRLRSERGVDRDEAQALVPEARRAAAPYPNDAAAQIVLAEAEYDAGNYDLAEAAADRAIAADPRMVDAHLYKARSIWARLAVAGRATPEQWREVRRILSAANRIDPNDPEPLVLFYQSYGASRAAPTANAIEGLLFAHQLAREDRTVRLAAGRELLAAGDADSARVVLSPFTSDSHSGGFGNLIAEVLATLAAEGPRAALARLDSSLAAQGNRASEGD
jgi:tetratricopeptide (TPR) repeat protein